MYHRTISAKLLKLKEQFPVLAILGPWQSGKTTLVRSLFPSHRYVNLEDFEEQEFATLDPKGFLNRYEREEGVVFDEIQRVPQLLSYIQIEVDERQQAGRFVLTGSQNILMNQQISQTLAGRIALMTLLPLSIEEMRDGQILPSSLYELIFRGSYPRSYYSNLDPTVFADSYIRTYLERDVQSMKQLASLADFQKFIRLCVARIGQLLNLSELATAAGLSVATVKSWLAILEASYVIFFLQPYFVNFNKRLVKMPKLYFYDTGLACNLLRISSADDVYDHYLRGGLFESLILADLMKKRYHLGLPPNLYFWRDKMGVEVDGILEENGKIRAIEIKSTETIQPDLFAGVAKWSQISGEPRERALIIYGGKEEQKRKEGHVLSWQNL